MSIEARHTYCLVRQRSTMWKTAYPLRDDMCILSEPQIKTDLADCTEKAESEKTGKLKKEQTRKQVIYYPPCGKQAASHTVYQSSYQHY